MNENDRNEFLEQRELKKKNLRHEEIITTIAVIMQKRDWYPNE